MPILNIPENINIDFETLTNEQRATIKMIMDGDALHNPISKKIIKCVDAVDEELNKIEEVLNPLLYTQKITQNDLNDLRYNLELLKLSFENLRLYSNKITGSSGEHLTEFFNRLTVAGKYTKIMKSITGKEEEKYSSIFKCVMDDGEKCLNNITNIARCEKKSKGEVCGNLKKNSGIVGIVQQIKNQPSIARSVIDCFIPSLIESVHNLINEEDYCEARKIIESFSVGDRIVNDVVGDPIYNEIIKQIVGSKRIKQELLELETKRKLDDESLRITQKFFKEFPTIMIPRDELGGCVGDCCDEELEKKKINYKCNNQSVLEGPTGPPGPIGIDGNKGKPGFPGNPGTCTCIEPPPKGACCIGDFCVDAEEKHCDYLYGQWRGEHSLCEFTRCEECTNNLHCFGGKICCNKECVYPCDDSVGGGCPPCPECPDGYFVCGDDCCPAENCCKKCTDVPPCDNPPCGGGGCVGDHNCGIDECCREGGVCGPCPEDCVDNDDCGPGRCCESDPHGGKSCQCCPWDGCLDGKELCRSVCDDYESCSCEHCCGVCTNCICSWNGSDCEPTGHDLMEHCCDNVISTEGGCCHMYYESDPHCGCAATVSCSDYDPDCVNSNVPANPETPHTPPPRGGIPEVPEVEWCCVERVNPTDCGNCVVDNQLVNCGWPDICCGGNDCCLESRCCYGECCPAYTECCGDSGCCDGICVGGNVCCPIISGVPHSVVCGGECYAEGTLCCNDEVCVPGPPKGGNPTGGNVCCQMEEECHGETGERCMYDFQCNVCCDAVGGTKCESGDSFSSCCRPLGNDNVDSNGYPLPNDCVIGPKSGRFAHSKFNDWWSAGATAFDGGYPSEWPMCCGFTAGDGDLGGDFCYSLCQREQHINGFWSDEPSGITVECSGQSNFIDNGEIAEAGYSQLGELMNYERLHRLEPQSSPNFYTGHICEPYFRNTEPCHDCVAGHIPPFSSEGFYVNVCNPISSNFTTGTNVNYCMQEWPGRFGFVFEQHVSFGASAGTFLTYKGGGECECDRNYTEPTSWAENKSWCESLGVEGGDPDKKFCCYGSAQNGDPGQVCCGVGPDDCCSAGEKCEISPLNAVYPNEPEYPPNYACIPEDNCGCWEWIPDIFGAGQWEMAGEGCVAGEYCCEGVCVENDDFSSDACKCQDDGTFVGDVVGIDCVDGDTACCDMRASCGQLCPPGVGPWAGPGGDCGAGQVCCNGNCIRVSQEDGSPCDDNTDSSPIDMLNGCYTNFQCGFSDDQTSPFYDGDVTGPNGEVGGWYKPCFWGCCPFPALHEPKQFDTAIPEWENGTNYDCNEDGCDTQGHWIPGDMVCKKRPATGGSCPMLSEHDNWSVPNNQSDCNAVGGFWDNNQNKCISGIETFCSDRNCGVCPCPSNCQCMYSDNEYNSNIMNCNGAGCRMNCEQRRDDDSNSQRCCTTSPQSNKSWCSGWNAPKHIKRALGQDVVNDVTYDDLCYTCQGCYENYTHIKDGVLFSTASCNEQTPVPCGEFVCVDDEDAETPICWDWAGNCNTCSDCDDGTNSCCEEAWYYVDDAAACGSLEWTGWWRNDADAKCCEPDLDYWCGRFGGYDTMPCDSLGCCSGRCINKSSADGVYLDGDDFFGECPIEDTEFYYHSGNCASNNNDWNNSNQCATLSECSTEPSGPEAPRASGPGKMLYTKVSKSGSIVNKKPVKGKDSEISENIPLAKPLPPTKLTTGIQFQIVNFIASDGHKDKSRNTGRRGDSQSRISANELKDNPNVAKPSHEKSKTIKGSLTATIQSNGMMGNSPVITFVSGSNIRLDTNEHSDFIRISVDDLNLWELLDVDDDSIGRPYNNDLLIYSDDIGWSGVSGDSDYYGPTGPTGPPFSNIPSPTDKGILYVDTDELSGSANFIGTTGDFTFNGNVFGVTSDTHFYSGFTVGGTCNFEENKLDKPQFKDITETVSETWPQSGEPMSGAIVDFDDGNVQYVEATGGVGVNAIILLNPPPSGYAGTATLVVTNGGLWGATGSSLVTNGIWSGGQPPKLTESGIDILSFLTIDEGNTVYCFLNGVDMS